MNGGILATESGFLLGLHLLVGSVLWADGSGAIRRVFEFPGGRTSLSGVGGLARDARGRVYAADTQGQRLLVFSPEGRPLGEVGGDRTPYERAGLNCIDLPGVLEDPNDVAVDQEGCVYVACGEQFMKNGVQKFSAAGEHLASFPSMGDPEGVFGGPRGLALHPDGTLWVCDTLRHGLQVFDRQGGFVGFLGHPHSDPLTAPLGVAFLPGGEVLVAEGGKSRRLVVLTARGALLRQFAPRTSPDAVPTQVSVWDEAVYVLERYTTGSGVRVLRYDLDGQLRAVPIADELDLARKVLAYLERSHPTTSAIQLRMANLYHYLLSDPRSLRVAARHYRQALELDPELYEACWDLADLELKMGHLARARELYLRCLELRPEDDSAVLRLAALYQRQGDLEGARRLLRQACQARPQSALLREEMERLEA